jgi:hypothetical protein
MRNWVSANVDVGVDATTKPYRIALNVSAGDRLVIAEVVV